ncbi:MAG: DUF1343 domain-containing protein [Chlorobi bacterium]|nr:DUF1343 domain-containing protein [Chlorobiota bacterium]
MRYSIIIKYFTLFLLFLLFKNLSAQNNFYSSGADELIGTNLEKVQNKNIALVSNKTAILQNGVHLIDALLNLKNIHIKKVFTPEHGFEGNFEAGALISDEGQSRDRIPFISLYGKSKKPSAEDLKDIDLLVYDIQDLGVRFYTYISTLYYVIEAAAENNIKILILDRPDPLNGNIVNGPLLNDDELSFVGIQPLPILYGMTPGELSLFFNDRIFERTGTRAEIEIVKLKNWNRDSFLNEYGNKWVSPSPNIPDFETALVYPGTALLEGTNVSEGRGTYSPFLQIGAPFIDGKLLLEKLNREKIKGVKLSLISFTPQSIKGMSERPKYLGQQCGGISVKITNPAEFNSVDFGINLVKTIQTLYPNKLKFNKHFEKLVGKSFYQNCFKKPYDCDYEKELNEFKKIRKKYLLYK